MGTARISNWGETMKSAYLLTSALALATPGVAYAAAPAPEPAIANADAPPATDTDIIVTGTRTTGTRAADSAAPIQIVGASSIDNVGQRDLRQVLGQNLPSLGTQSFGGDAANLTLNVALRGISPNDTLVLVNGKRRHFTANLAVLGGSPYSGAATTDLSFIPTGSIGRVEVLQDGAAAQYGSDAIAGVVNIILRNDDHGGQLSLTGGQFYKGDGKTVEASFNNGFKLGDRGFLNITGEYRFHDYTQRGTYDYRFFNPDGSLRSTVSALNAAGLKGAPNYPYVNRILGDARSQLWNLAFNAGYDVTDGVHAYAFGNYGRRTASARQNYRAPSRYTGTDANGQTVVPFPNGFTPRIALDEEDFSLTAGLSGEADGWTWDGSLTYGRVADALYTRDSINAAVWLPVQKASAVPVRPQTNYYDGTLTNSEWVADLGLTHEVDLGLAKPLTLAIGGQYRDGKYGIQNGELGAYYQGGPAAYPGFGPSDAGTNGRRTWAGYIDAALDPTEGLHVDLAGRYEHYSDFGSVWTGKATARYDFSSAFGLRGTVSNGFRAPTLAEQYYSSTNVSPNSIYAQLAPNSPAVAALGFGKLKPEKSTNLSAGFVAHPGGSLQLTVDAYQIKITNRIVASGGIVGYSGGFGTNGVVSPAVLATLAARGLIASTDPAVVAASGYSFFGLNLFTNGADTRTRGVEATLNATTRLDGGDRIDWSLGFNYNRTKVTRIASLPAAVYNAAFGQTTLLTRNALDALTTATPRVKVIAGALVSHGPLSLNLRETLYGVTRQHVSLDGTGSGNTVVGTPTTLITDINLGWKATSAFRIDVGANNLLNHKATTAPSVVNGGVAQPVDGSNVLDRPLSLAPWGINGGYYYARVTLSF